MDEAVFHVGLAESLAALVNFAGVVALAALVVTFVRGNRRLAVRWLAIFVVCVTMTIGLLFFGALFAL